jgi:hypothetical protein
MYMGFKTVAFGEVFFLNIMLYASFVVYITWIIHWNEMISDWVKLS